MPLGMLDIFLPKWQRHDLLCSALSDSECPCYFYPNPHQPHSSCLCLTHPTNQSRGRAGHDSAMANANGNSYAVPVTAKASSNQYSKEILSKKNMNCIVNIDLQTMFIRFQKTSINAAAKMCKEMTAWERCQEWVISHTAHNNMSKLTADINIFTARYRIQFWSP